MNKDSSRERHFHHHYHPRGCGGTSVSERVYKWMHINKINKRIPWERATEKKKGRKKKRVNQNNTVFMCANAGVLLHAGLQQVLQRVVVLILMWRSRYMSMFSILFFVLCLLPPRRRNLPVSCCLLTRWSRRTAPAPPGVPASSPEPAGGKTDFYAPADRVDAPLWFHF